MSGRGKGKTAKKAVSAAPRPACSSRGPHRALPQEGQGVRLLHDRGMLPCTELHACRLQLPARMLTTGMLTVQELSCWCSVLAALDRPCYRHCLLLEHSRLALIAK